MSGKLIWGLALGTLLGFGGGGLIIIYFVRDGGLLQFMTEGKSLLLQIAVGVAFGVIMAQAGWGIVELPPLRNTRQFFARLIAPLNLRLGSIIFISLCAAVGEELFFRGGIQPLVGIWPTSIIFVLLHGYINPFNLPLTVYGIFMTLVIAVMGYMTEHLGIFAAIAAHAAIDYVLLNKLAGVPLDGH
jgi:hypothetical protein